MDKKRIVIKVGTSTVTYENGNINIYGLEQLCKAISDLQNAGNEIILVSSGAIGVGTKKLNLNVRPKDTVLKQATAAVGQCELMLIYRKLFAEYSNSVAQILLTRDIIDNELTKKNVINTIETLLSMGIIPIANENDTVATDELEGHNFSDNDMLSSIVAVISKADILIILTDTDGLYTSNPQQNSSATKIDIVNSVDDAILSMASDGISKCGTGGMFTKVEAAKRSTENGIETYIISGKQPDNIYKVLNGENIGTKFEATRREAP